MVFTTRATNLGSQRCVHGEFYRIGLNLLFFDSPSRSVLSSRARRDSGLTASNCFGFTNSVINCKKPIDAYEVAGSLTDKNVAYGIQTAAFASFTPIITHYFKLFAIRAAVR